MLDNQTLSDTWLQSICNPAPAAQLGAINMETYVISSNSIYLLLILFSIF